MKEAISLLGILNKRVNTKISITFIPEDKGYLFYEINGSGINWTVRHKSTSSCRSAVYAVARIAELVFNAKLLLPDVESLTVNPYKELTDINEIWTPPPHRWVGTTSDSVLINGIWVKQEIGERTWFDWHHMPIIDDKSIHFSNFDGIALKYPQLAAKHPKNPPLNETTKLDLRKIDEIAPILFQIWLDKGKPKEFSLFELDGTNFDYTYVTPPPNLTPSELEFFKSVVTGGAPNLAIIGKYVSQNFIDNIRNWIPFDNSDRIILTEIYLKFYKGVEKYFKDNGADCRFRILAYSAYYLFPKNSTYDLSNFTVYYTARTNDPKGDRLNWKYWERTGAKMIWRPNLWYAWPLMPYTRNHLIAQSVLYTRTNEYMIDGYSYCRMFATQGFNYYTLARMQRGISYFQAFKEWRDAFGFAGAYVGEFITISKSISEREVILSKGQQKTDVGSIPLLYTKDDIIELSNSLVMPEYMERKLTPTQSYLFNWFKSGFEISKMAYDLSINKIHYVEFINDSLKLNDNFLGIVSKSNLVRCMGDIEIEY
jgi:hypothetical protein